MNLRSNRRSPAVVLSLLFMFAVAAPVLAQGPGVDACSKAKSAWFSALGPDGAWQSAASANFDAGYYTLDIDVDVTGESIAGVVQVMGRVVGSPMTELRLDFADNMSVTSVLSPPYAASDTLQFSHANNVLAVTLPATAGVGEAVAVEVHYAGSPDPEYFEFGNQGGAAYAFSYSEPYGARAWWPCKDHPSDKADSVDVRVTVPDYMSVGSQGNLIFTGVAGVGREVFEWHSRYPIATYLVSVAAGQYVQFDEVYNRPAALESEFGPLTLPLVHLMYDDGSSAVPSGWQYTADALGVLEWWYGPYPFAAEKYGHAEWSRTGAMEHQTLTSMGSTSRTVMVHELAHQWFGDLISPRTWPQLWLNEGFATYAEYLYWEQHDGEIVGGADAVIRTMISNATGARGHLVLDDTTSVSDMFNPARVYNKGGVVLHMLRGVVGNANFHEILREYVADPSVAGGSATTADFQRVAESVYGQSLDTFFSQWVTEGTGYPRYRVTAYLQRRGNYAAYVTLEQTQAPSESSVNVFEMPVTFDVTTDAGVERFTVVNDRRRQDYVFEVTAPPVEVAFDADRWLLRDDIVEPATHAVPTRPVLEAVLQNPISRAGAVQIVLPDDRAATLRLYDVAGRFVRDVGRVAGPGPHRVSLEGGDLPSGVYFLHMEAPGGSAVRKITIVR